MIHMLIVEDKEGNHSWVGADYKNGNGDYPEGMIDKGGLAEKSQ